MYGTGGGFLDNCIQNVSVLLDHLARRLSVEDGMARAVQRAKFIYARVASLPRSTELAERCDFVVAAPGD